jgi:iron complex outermembrane receptor protein
MTCRPRFPLGAAAIAASVMPLHARADEPSVEEVNVRGAAAGPERAPKDTTVAGAVLGREEVSAPGVQAADLLRGQLGVQVSEIGGAGAPATATIRGATSAQLPVYLAGVLLNDDVAGAADLSRVPLWLIDRIEIYRGNAPLEADRLGIAGAIFFEPRWPRKPAAGVGGTFGSYGARAAWGYAATGNRDAAVLAGVSTEAATNDYPFVNDNGTLLAPTGSSIAHMTNAEVTTYDTWLLARARAGPSGEIDTFVNATTREQGVPTLALVPSREARGAFDRILGGANTRVGLDSAERLALEAHAAASVARAVYTDPLDELALLTHRLELDGARVDEGVALRLQATDSLAIRTAVDVASETLDRNDENTPVLRGRRLASRAAVSARQWIGEALSVQALAAGQCDGTSVTSTSTCDVFAPVGRLGVAFTQPTWEVFANVGRYLRVPTLGELYGTSVVVHGNPMLDPESGITTDMGARWTERTTGETPAPWVFAGAFVRWSSDLVSFVRSSEGYVEPFNVTSARVAGLEARAGVAFLRFFALDASATLEDPRDTTPRRTTVNDFLPFQSRLVAAPRLSAEVRHLALRPLGRLRAEVRWVYQSSRYASTSGLAVIPEQSSLDAELLAQTSNEVWSLRFRAADILDSQRFDIVGFPLPGRSFFLSLEAAW